MSSNRGNQFIGEARAANKAIWDAVNRLQALQVEWNAMDYSKTLLEGEAGNKGVAPADVEAVVFDTTNAIVALMARDGHASKMAKLL